LPGRGRRGLSARPSHRPPDARAVLKALDDLALAAEQAGAATLHLALEHPAPEAAAGQPVSLVLRVTAEPTAVPVQVPLGALDLAVYVEAPGFYLEGAHLRTLAVSRGQPLEQELHVRLLPRAGGDHAVRLLAYPGASGAAPAELSCT